MAYTYLVCKSILRESKKSCFNANTHLYEQKCIFRTDSVSLCATMLGSRISRISFRGEKMGGERGRTIAKSGDVVPPSITTFTTAHPNSCTTLCRPARQAVPIKSHELRGRISEGFIEHCTLMIFDRHRSTNTLAIALQRRSQPDLLRQKLVSGCFTSHELV